MSSARCSPVVCGWC